LFLIVQAKVQCVETVHPRRSFPTVEELPEIKDLPNPFVFFDGSPVKSKSDWNCRREEIKAMMLHYQFGHAPELPRPDTIKSKIVSEDSDFILFEKPLPAPKSFYQEPWPKMPKHYSWEAPAE
jgi:hypothetical protein